MLQSAAARGSIRESSIHFPLLSLDIFSTVGAELPLKVHTKVHKNSQTPPEEGLGCGGAEEDAHLSGSGLVSEPGRPLMPCFTLFSPLSL